MFLSHKRIKGFTVIELLVSISIIGILLSVVFKNQAFYSDSIALSNLADTLSLTLSEAQAYGIAVKELSPGTNDFSSPYGLSLSLLPEGSDTAYILFADRNSNGTYDGDWTCPTGGASECLEKQLITRGNIISQLCHVDGAGAEVCSADIRRFDVTFVRPNPGATIRCYDQNGALCASDTYPGAKFKLMSPGGAVKSVVVNESGQISVQ